MGYFLSMFFSREMVGLVGTGFALSWALVLSGVNPQLNEIMKPESPFHSVYFLWAISSPRYAIEALYLREVRARGFQDYITNGFSYGYKIENEYLSLLRIAQVALGWLVAAFLGLKMTHRDKQK
jgi:hypothetical protein